jgi:hypothetical protein
LSAADLAPRNIAQNYLQSPDTLYIPTRVCIDQSGFIRGRNITENFAYAADLSNAATNGAFRQLSSSWTSEKLLTPLVGLP